MALADETSSAAVLDRERVNTSNVPETVRLPFRADQNGFDSSRHAGRMNKR